jgi:hypothetical protein
MAYDSEQGYTRGNKSRTGSGVATAPESAPTTSSKSHRSSSYGPSRDEIARKAYEIWKSRGCPHGQDVPHWLEAERLLTR